MLAGDTASPLPWADGPAPRADADSRSARRGADGAHECCWWRRRRIPVSHARQLPRRLSAKHLTNGVDRAIEATGSRGSTEDVFFTDIWRRQAGVSEQLTT